MKLKAFNQLNSSTVRIGKPTIRFSKSAGLITFSRQAAMDMGLEDGTRIELCQNEDAPTDWYIHVTDNESGFELRNEKDTGRRAFNCTAIVKRVLGSLNIDTGASFVISKEPEVIDGEKYYFIITRNPIAGK